MGRVLVQEGDIERAKQVLERALSLEPNLARTHYFYARSLRAEGKYDEAIQHLRIVEQQYPKDRVVINDIGRIYFLQHKYENAVNELKKVLTIDPEDLQANYNLMLCYHGLGQVELAREHEMRYLRFKADEAAQALTGKYRMEHPEDNNERQSIHEHDSAPLRAPTSQSRVKTTRVRQYPSFIAPPSTTPTGVPSGH